MTSSNPYGQKLSRYDLLEVKPVTGKEKEEINAHVKKMDENSKAPNRLEKQIFQGEAYGERNKPRKVE